MTHVLAKRASWIVPLLFVLLAAGAARAEPCPGSAGPCAVLIDNGTSGAKLDVAVMGDGYTAGEEAKFFADADQIVQALFADGPYGAYRPLFNAFALYTPSVDSGADDPSANVFVDTAYDASYDSFDIPYLLTVNEAAVLGDVAARCPACDLVVLIVNAAQYGGAGGAVAVVSLDENAVEIARHEIGHTLAGLADEYPDPYPGYPIGDSEPNVAAIHHLHPLEWDPWVTPGTPIPTPEALATGDHTPVGAFEGARYQTVNMFRPTVDCIMRTLGISFCQVCNEAMVLAISDLSSTIEAPTPTGQPSVAPLGSTTVFGAALPALSNLEVSWTLDGVDQNVQASTFDLQPASAGLSVGLHTLVLTVVDTTPAVRSDPGGVLVESYVWNVAVTLVDCALEGDGTPCDDGDACTTADACASGLCAGTPPPPCAAPQPCELPGACHFASGVCEYPPKICPAPGKCRLLGTCNPANGQCDSPNAPDDSACDDGNACTLDDRCAAGSCQPGAAAVCPSDVCQATSCDVFNGVCGVEPEPDGAPCDDGDACTLAESCAGGACVAASTVTCDALDECHAVGTCDALGGACTQPLMPDGTPCSAGQCTSGVCTAPPPNVDDGGCGCRLAPTRGSIAWVVAALAACGALLQLRRRSGRGRRARPGRASPLAR